MATHAHVARQFRRQSENQLALACRRWLELDWFVHRLRADKYCIACPNCGTMVRTWERAEAKAVAAGTLDYIVTRFSPKTETFYWEAKTPDGELEPSQKAMISFFRKHHIPHFVGADINELHRWMTIHGFTVRPLS